jgi:hypothetical protein
MLIDRMGVGKEQEPRDVAAGFSLCSRESTAR